MFALSLKFKEHMHNDRQNASNNIDFQDLYKDTKYSALYKEHTMKNSLTLVCLCVVLCCSNAYTALKLR